jgi:hypothetical protein
MLTAEGYLQAMTSLFPPIGYLGDTQTIQYENFIEICKSSNYRVFPFEAALANNSQILSRSGLSRKLSMLRSFSHGTISTKYKHNLDEYLHRTKVRCIVSYWGTNTFKDIISIKKCHPEIKIVLNILCHPMGLTKHKIFFQNLLMWYENRFVDGIVFSSRVMENYFRSNGLNKNSLCLVLPPLLSKYYFPQYRLKPVANVPNLLYMGRMDWWNGQPTDNITSQINALLDYGIHIYHSDKTGIIESHPFRHLFYPMDLKRVTEFASQFDASFIIYNLSACKQDDRFRLTIPDRLIASVTAGIPVVLPKDGYDACKEFLTEYQSVIEFETLPDLKSILLRRNEIHRLRELAQKNSQKFIFENHLESFSNFLSKFL